MIQHPPLVSLSFCLQLPSCQKSSAIGLLHFRMSKWMVQLWCLHTACLQGLSVIIW